MKGINPLRNHNHNDFNGFFLLVIAYVPLTLLEGLYFFKKGTIFYNSLCIFEKLWSVLPYILPWRLKSVIMKLNRLDSKMSLDK